MKKLLILGGSGFTGKNLYEYLKNKCVNNGRGSVEF